MSDDDTVSFREFYGQFYAEKHASLSTAQEARAILSAFIDYRQFLNLPCRPEDTRQGVTPIYKLIYHKRMMESAEASEQAVRAEQHWRAALKTWEQFLCALYVDDACHPGDAPSVALFQRIRLWWHRRHVSAEAAPTALPRRAWAMVWAVDSLRDQSLIESRNGKSSCGRV